MKVQAIIFSPILGITSFWIIISILSINSKSDDWSEFLFIYLVISFVALFAQLFIEFLILLIEFFTKMNYKIYLQLASIICLLIWILSFWSFSNYDFYKRLSESFITFILFYIYSIGNAITYNYLYFSKLNKEIGSYVIQT
jgi:hypothetical protein